MFESRISARTMEKLLETKATEKPDAKAISSWSFDLEGHAKNCVKHIANWQTKQLNNHTKSPHHAWMTINLKKKKLNQVENCPQFAHKLFCNVYSWHVLAGLIFNGL